MKCRKPDETHKCLLFDRSVTWTTCVEVQEVREDNMDMDLFAIPFDIEKANILCEQCKWYIVNPK